MPLLADIRSRGSAPSDAWLKGDYDTDKQVWVFSRHHSFFFIKCIALEHVPGSRPTTTPASRCAKPLAQSVAGCPTVGAARSTVLRLCCCGLHCSCASRLKSEPLPWGLQSLQAELCRRIALALGFSLEKGRLDVSVHPFTGGEWFGHPLPVAFRWR